MPPTVGFSFHFRPYQTVSLTIKEKNTRLWDKHLKGPHSLDFFCFHCHFRYFPFIRSIFFHLFLLFILWTGEIVPWRQTKVFYIHKGKVIIQNPDCDLYHCTLNILNCEWACYLLIWFSSYYMKLHNSLYVSGYFALYLPSLVRFMLKIFL